ncbi:MAG: ABC transporter ATP-binding protein [Eubacteriales bacterium]|nr:ABC transporter ATP-binding protein [Eubacteriales bacterium]
MIFGKHINRYYLRYALPLLLGLVSLVAVDWFQLEIPKLYRMVINGMNTGAVESNGGTVPFDMDFLLEKICLPLCLVIAVVVTGRFLWRVCIFGSAIRMETDLRGRMFDRSRGLSCSFYQTNKVGNLMSLYTSDLETVQDCFGSGVLMMFDACFQGGLAVSRMWGMNRMLTLLSLIPVAFLLAGGVVLGKYLQKKWDRRQQAYADLSDFVQENFSGIAVIKAFVKESLELMAFRKLNRKNEETNIDYTRLSVLLRILVTLFVESVICVILGYGGYLVWAGTFNAGQLMEFIGYFTAVVWPAMAVSELIEMHSRGKASLARIGKLLDTEPDVKDAPDVAPIPEPVRGEITFSHLTFRYPGGEHDVLHDITLTIRAGERVGLVGKTGSGKTTLVDLLLRTYNVPDGTVFLDGHDVNRIPIRQVRASAAYVPQDNFLFSDTIANNIAFGVDQPKRFDVEAAAVLADVDGNIREFRDGYDTVLGEWGVTVSGGQRQRISIARALMKDAPVLILDDSVSAVDTDTERVILGNLRRTREGKTTVLIAHRISTIEQMDRILFLDEGRLIATGTHTELYETCPAYRRAVDLQRLEEEGGEYINA